VIDLYTAKAILLDVVERMDTLQGEELMDIASTDKPGQVDRARKAEVSRGLQWIADSLLLASGLTRNELWIFKGENDALAPKEAP
jgi:hypothetical protein